MAKIYGEIAASGLMTFDKSFSRSNGQPLDSTEIFYSLSAAETYAATDVAYVGQKVVVIETENEVTTVTHYGIEADNSLKELGSSPVGDESTIVVADDGTISLAGVSGLEFTETNTDGEEVTVTYQPLMTKDGLTWVKPSATTVEGLAAEIEGLKTRVSALETEASNINAKIGAVAEGKTVVEMISDAQTAATYDDTQVKSDIKANTDAIDAIEADYLKSTDKYDDTALAGRVTAVEGDVSTLKADVETVGSIDYKIAQAVAAIMENPDETINSINELVTWCNDHASDALELSNKVSANEEDISALEELVGETGVAEQITQAIEASLKVDGADKYALASALTDAIARVAALEAKVVTWDAAEQNAKDYADGLNVAIGERVDAVEEVLDGKVDAEDGKSLIADSLIEKLSGVADGAQVNIIDSVDGTYFSISDDKELTLLDIAVDKVDGLQSLLDGKANKGTTLADYGITDAYTKTETENRLKEVLDGLSDTSETAASVAQELEAYKTANDQRVLTVETKLADVENGAQVNVIESVKIGESLLDIVDKSVKIPVATTSLLGVVLGSTAENKVSVAADGTMEVNSINVNKLVQTEDEYLVISGGSAAGHTVSAS